MNTLHTTKGLVMLEQLSRIEAKVDRIDGNVNDLRESKGEQSGTIKGHTSQLALLWTITFLIIGGVCAAYFKV